MSKSTKNRRRLLEILDRLPPEKVELVTDFAQFLFEHYGTGTQSTKPLSITPPPDESVVDAIKRMRATYPMLDPANLLQHCAELMTQHIMSGRDRQQIISELESLFQQQYQTLTSKNPE